jgi:hypothetical protein
MTQKFILLDPTGEQTPAQRERVPRPASLAGLTIGLLDISKARGNIFLDRLQQHLLAQGLTVKRFKKPTFTRVAPIPLQQEITSQCQVVIEALAD